MEVHSFAKYFRKCTFQSTEISSFHFNFLGMQNRYKTQQRLNSKIISKIYSRFVLAQFQFIFYLIHETRRIPLKDANKPFFSSFIFFIRPLTSKVIGNQVLLLRSLEGRFRGKGYEREKWNEVYICMYIWYNIVIDVMDKKKVLYWLYSHESNRKHLVPFSRS